MTLLFFLFYLSDVVLLTLYLLNLRHTIRSLNIKMNIWNRYYDCDKLVTDLKTCKSKTNNLDYLLALFNWFKIQRKILLYIYVL